MSKRLLDLSTLVDRPVIRIDGVDYQMMERADLGIVDQMRLWQTYGRVAQIRGKALEEIAETDSAVIADALEVLVRIIIPDLPEAVRLRLREEQKLEILEGFTLAAGSQGTTTTLPPTESPPTSAP